MACDPEDEEGTELITTKSSTSNDRALRVIGWLLLALVVIGEVLAAAAIITGGKSAHDRLEGLAIQAFVTAAALFVLGAIAISDSDEDKDS